MPAEGRHDRIRIDFRSIPDVLTKLGLVGPALRHIFKLGGDIARRSAGNLMTGHAIAFGAVDADAPALRDGILGRIVLVIARLGVWRLASRLYGGGVPQQTQPPHPPGGGGYSRVQ